MHSTAVADLGGLLVLARLVDGIDHKVDEVLALDATSVLVAQFLAVRHEGAPDAARAAFAVMGRVVHEWFPVRAFALETALSAPAEEDINGLAALALSESLSVPLVTMNRDLVSKTVPVLYC